MTGLANAQLPAFPGAEGAGAFAQGGRNSGNVYVVTNLNNSGIGSLRHGVNTAPSSGRTIVFGVSGTINLSSDLVIDSPYLTIAGQTAPDGGITLARRMVRVNNTHDVILQHLRIRPGDYYTGGPGGPATGYEPDALWVSGSNNVMLDHLSASWSTDEVLSVSHGSTNVTVQWSLMTEALHNSNHSKGNHGYGGIIHGGETTLHHNLYANNRSRNPATGNWDKNAPITPAHLDIVNNVISNPGDRYSYSGSSDQYQVNWAGNFGVEGPDTTRENELFHPDNINTFVYYDGNYYDTSADGLLQLTPANSRTLTGTYTSLDNPVATTNPPLMSDAPTAYQQVLSYAGASAWRDPIDKRVIDDVVNQAGNQIDSQEQVGGWYNPASQTQTLGSDGLPAWWKTAHGFDPNDNTVGHQFAPDGYTYLEKYLHHRNAPYLPPQSTSNLSVSTAYGNGADAQISETSGAASGSGAGAQLNARWAGPGGSINELVLLRFDLSQILPGSVADVALDLTAFRDMAGDSLRVYGLKHEAAGQEWDENTVTFANAPGVAFDGNSGTRGLESEQWLLLGEFTTTGIQEGEVLEFTNPDLSVFLNTLAYRDEESSLVTLLLERQNTSTGQSRFASKEATALENGQPAPAGTYAPQLILDARPNLNGDFDRDGDVDAEDLGFWQRGFGLKNATYKLQGEGTNDGRVNGGDFLGWQRDATGSAVQPQRVPESSSLWLFGLGMLALCLPRVSERSLNLNKALASLKSRIISLGWCSFLILALAQPVVGQALPAFPGAEGPGADASGGRTGDVYHVTNLQDDHDGTIPGSLRYGLNTAPAAGRTIVFDVGGTITLVPDVHQSTHTWLRSGNSNITIAGQTAPGPGITIAGQGAKFSGDNWIVRNVKFRPGMDQTRPGIATNDGISNNLQNSIIDHVSISWADDEGLSSTDAVVNTTVQYSIIGEGLNYNDHSYGSLISSEVNDAQLSYHHNLYLHNRSRNPRLGSENGTGAVLNFSNNVVYNWSGWAGYSFEKPSRTNFLSNYYIAGSNTGAGDPVFYSPDTETKIHHQYGNRVDMNKNGTVDGTTFAFSGPQFQGTVALILRSPYNVASGHVQSAEAAVEQVLGYVGAQWWDRDPVDLRLTEDVRNGTGTAINYITDAPQDPNYSYDADGYPVYGFTQRPIDFDVDNDGMADSWELAHGLSTSLADNAGDFDNDGYTNLEEYLNDLAAFPAPTTIGWIGGSGRYAEIQNWGINQTIPVETFSNWQPSRLDIAEIKTGTVSVDSAGQHAGVLQVAPASGDIATLNITGGWLEVANTLEIAESGADGQVNLSDGVLRAGTVSKGPGGSFQLTGGTLVAHVVEFDLTNSGGTIAPGQSPGVTQVVGDLDMQAGVLELELAGANAGQYDQILVDGLLTAGGTLQVVLNDFVPSLGESFDLLDFGSIAGEFSYDLPLLPMGLGWDTSAILDTGVVSVMTLTSGDLDGDGDVDGNDFLIWQRGYPLEYTLADLQAWESGYGTSTNVLSGAKATVPEPHSLNTMLMALLCIFSLPVYSWFSCGRRKSARTFVVCSCLFPLLITAEAASATPVVDEHSPDSQTTMDESGGGKEIESSAGWERVPEILKRIVPPKFPERDFLITDYGAVSGGEQSCTEAFQKAVAACQRAGGGRVVVPAGTFLSGPIHLKSSVNLHLSADAEIVFSDRFEDYLPVVLVRVGGVELYNYSPLIYARDCSNIAVTGSGKLNGNAETWWEWARGETRRGFEMGENGIPLEERIFGTPEDKIRPSFLSFVNCDNILLENFTIGSAPNWTIHPIYCTNTTIRSVHVVTEGPNNDGIDPDSCRDMLIENCTFDTGDDCVVLKSGYNQDGWRVGRPTENVIMRNCSCMRGHGGLVIGSEMSGDVRNVYMENCRFEGTDRIVRIKSRADRGGVVENVFVRNVQGSDLQRDAIILNMGYSADSSALKHTTPPVFQNMLFQDVTSKGAPIALHIQGMKESPIRNVVFEDMILTALRGVQAHHVSHLRFENVQVVADEGPTFSLSDANNVTIEECSASQGADPFLQLEGSSSKQVVIENCNLTAAKQTVVTSENVEPNSVVVR